MINVLIVEDSPSETMLLRHILESDPGIQVVKSVGNGEAALRFLAAGHRGVDVVTMDIVMPGIDGFTTTSRIMKTTPLPIVVISAAYKSPEAENSFRAMEAGAVAIIEKPTGPRQSNYQGLAARMVETVKLMAEVKVVTRWDRERKGEPAMAGKVAAAPPRYWPEKIDVVAIGASTGGPPVLKEILAALPPDFPVPILMVQHISGGFTDGLARWLETETGFPVSIPRSGEQCLPGHAYLGPDSVQMGLGRGLRVKLEEDAPEHGQRPSVSYLFRSVARHYPGRAVGVLLTGMGSDGAAELKIMKDAGCLTLIQDEASCVVFGMPGEAAKIGAAHFVLPPPRIACEILRALDRLCNRFRGT